MLVPHPCSPLCAVWVVLCWHSPEAKRILGEHPLLIRPLEHPSFLVSGAALLRTNKPFLEIFEVSWEDPVLAQSPS